MSVYRIVITPEPEGDRASRGEIEATIRVETAQPTPRIIEMTIRSTASGGLFVGGLAGIDFEAITAALASGVQAAVTEPVAPEGDSRPEAEAPDRSASRFAGQPVAVSAKVSGDRSEDEPLLTQTTLPTPRSQKVVPAPPAPTEPAGRAASNGSGRAYRRMPDVDEVLAAFERTGGVTGLARHFGVPRHTAQGWMSRVRKLTGKTPS